jgi:hypothetical protein
MKLALPSAALTLILSSTCNWSQVGLAKRSATQGSEQLPKASLQLTTSVAEQAYCSDGHVRMLLKLKYTNIGSESIVLKKGSIAISRLTVSRSQRAAARRDYEKVAHFFYSGVAQQNSTPGREPPRDKFVILSPGDTYEVDTKQIFHDLRVNNYFDLDNLRKGAHYLQISVNTWEEDPRLAEELSVGWRKFGVLWWEGVTSQPMPFTIEKPASTIECQ